MKLRVDFRKNIDDPPGQVPYFTITALPDEYVLNKTKEIGDLERFEFPLEVNETTSFFKMAGLPE